MIVVELWFERPDPRSALRLALYGLALAALQRAAYARGDWWCWLHALAERARITPELVRFAREAGIGGTDG